MSTTTLDRPAAPATPTTPDANLAALKPTWEADFRRDGHLVLPGLLDAATIAVLKTEIDDYVAAKGAKRPLDFHHHGMLLTEPTVMAVVTKLMGPGFAFHHLHTARHDAGTGGVNWHHDYEQHPQTNRNFAMVHVFFYLNGLDGSVGDLLLRPGSQHWILARNALGECGTADLPGSIVIDRLEPGSAVIVHSACLHARRPKPGGEGRPRYFLDSSYCQAGIRWPSYWREWQAMLAAAKASGFDRGGRYAHLFDPAHFFDAPEACKRLDRLNTAGSLIEHLPQDA